MKFIWIRILVCVLSLCLLLPVAGCGPETVEDETIEEVTSHYVSVVTRDEPSVEETTDPEEALDDTMGSEEGGDGEDGLSEINQLRKDYNLGTCKRLSGEVAVVLFFMDDFESQWTREERECFTQNEVRPALAFLEQEAEKYGVELKLTVEQSYSSIKYDGEVIQNVKESEMVTSDVLWQISKRKIYSSTEDMLKSFRNRYITEEVICLAVFNKDGTSHAINPRRGADIVLDEHCVLFARDLYTDTNGPDGSQTALIASTILYLYGAESFRASESRETIATYQYPDDLMLYASYDIRMNTVSIDNTDILTRNIRIIVDCRISSIR